ncbi:Hypothetical protein NCS54_00623600 [Fusarium falciforme]|uniref:Hypothetical protein n=1 Tax=Fusarium falciforme TaxID=195108 RepID=UPI0022FFE5EB|nr:Hypothetical protein NCS54_00623600 [Fusarium falciforme]WAO88872.1 Hypothetical protein NCS54_00623600 [Fusarium falciforme]
MPPPPDPWDPHVPSLPEDAEPSRHANTLDPDDPEASHFLDNLDISAFGPCDFNFSSLMDLDQVTDPSLPEIPELNMTDMFTMPIGDFTVADLPVLEASDFQAPTTFGPESTLVSDHSWLHDAPGSTEFGFPAIEAPASFPEPSNVTNFLSPSLDSNNLGLPENCHNWRHDGNTSQLPRDFRKPSPDRIREAEKQLLREYPSGTAVDFLWGTERPDRFHWVYTLAFFCSGKRSSNPHEEEATKPIRSWPQPEHSPDDILMWFYCRYAELCLFNYLQEKANNPRKATEDQKMFIYSAFFILKHSISQGRLDPLGTSLSGHDMQREIQDHLDRQTRVRTALWIFASVFISKLPAYTDFWNHLPQQVDFFRRGPRKNMRKSLADLDTDLLLSSDDTFSRKRKLLRHLFSGTLRETSGQDDSRFLWRDMRSTTPQGIAELEHISASPLGDLADRARLYEQHEAERVMIPKTREQRNEAAHRFFGGLLSMTESPVIQNEASFYQPDGSARPSSLCFMVLFSIFIHRIPGRCAYHAGKYAELPAAGWNNMNFQLCEVHKVQSGLDGAEECIKRSHRWLNLASLLGDGAYLMGGTRKVDRHPFLDVEYVIDHGTEGDFSRLRRLLSRNGSWIRAICVELNGLAQALIQISDTDQLAKVRPFQRLLYRKCRSAFAEIVSSEGGAKLTLLQQLGLEHMKRTLLDLLPPSSEVEEGRRWVRNTFKLAILEAIEDISRGKEEAPPESHIVAWICYPGPNPTPIYPKPESANMSPSSRARHWWRASISKNGLQVLQAALGLSESDQPSPIIVAIDFEQTNNLKNGFVESQDSQLGIAAFDTKFLSRPIQDEEDLITTENYITGSESYVKKASNRFAFGESTTIQPTELCVKSTERYLKTGQ